jgi:hypothetical protein
MIGRNPVIGLAVLCALAISAFASASASAEQRAYTCTTSAPAGSKNFSDEHCVVPTEPGKGTRGHVLIGSEPTLVTVTNGKTASSTTAATSKVLRGTLAGVKTKITCTTVTGTGTITNAAASVSGTGKITFSGCTVEEPAGKGCVITGGKIESSAKITTVGQATTKIKIEPSEAGSSFASVPIEGCAGEVPPKGSYPTTGSFTVTAEGATTSVTLAGSEAEGKLKFGGNKTGIEGKVTLRMVEGEPIVFT